MKRELKAGSITKEYYKEWRKEALINPEKPKSRTITRRAINEEEMEKQKRATLEKRAQIRKTQAEL